MKNKIISSFICISLLVTNIAFATPVTSPGSSNDPVVSKSYVDELIGDILGKILGLEKTYSELKTQVDTIEQAIVEGVSSDNQTNNNDNINNNTNNEVTEVVSNYTFKPIELSNNQLLLCGEGTELILRSGSAVGYTEVANGLTDVTDGNEIMNNDEVPANHVLIIPRADNRGILVTSNQTWVMIRGDYTIINR